MPDDQKRDQIEISESDESVKDNSEETVLDQPEDRGKNFNLGVVLDVPLRVSVEIGDAKMLVRDVLQLGIGSVIELDRMNGDLADIFVNGERIARGEVTVVDDRMAVRITELPKRDRSQEAV